MIELKEACDFLKKYFCEISQNKMRNFHLRCELVMLFNQTHLTIWTDIVKYRIFCGVIEHAFPKLLCSQTVWQKWKFKDLEASLYSEIQNFGIRTSEGQTLQFNLSANTAAKINVADHYLVLSTHLASDKLENICENMIFFILSKQIEKYIIKILNVKRPLAFHKVRWDLAVLHSSIYYLFVCLDKKLRKQKRSIWRGNEDIIVK